MLQSAKKSLFYVGSLCACFIMSLTTGCASGGYKLTRQYSSWVNSQQIIIRIILYILTGVVFGITLLVDFVIFNTVDFWGGKVSQGDYQFKDAEKTYFVKHEVDPQSQLKKSTIRIVGEDQKTLQTVALIETVTHQIEMYVDGQLRTKVSEISALPTISSYSPNGELLESKAVYLGSSFSTSVELAAK